MGKGSNTTTTQSSSSADPQAAQLYRDILGRAQGVASTPYQAYTGELTAPINAQQQAGISGINANANYASPFIQQAAGIAGSSTSPITGSTIQGYQSPYTQQVIDATMGQMQHDNASQQASLQGNQIAQGALGGNATGVAKGILAGQQGRTMASTTAGLYDQSYKQALQAAQQQQQTGLAGANALANYGISGQNAALTGATAQLGAGSMMQQNEQARLNALYQQYAQAQSYPYQQTQWLAGVGTGIGSNLGGTSSGSSTAPAPNQTAQWLGAGLSAASLLSDERAKEDIERVGKMNDGTAIYRYRYKGSPQWHVGPMAQEVEQRNPDAVSRGVDGMRYVDMHEATEDSIRRASGGGVGVVPWADAAGASWIPQMNIHGGSGPPRSGAPSSPGNTGGSFDPTKMAQGISGAVKGVGGLDWSGMLHSGGNFSGDAWGGGSFGGGDAYGGSSASPLAGLDPLDYGAGFADGGAVMSDEDPVGIAGGQQYAQQAGSPWQMRPSGNGQVQVINVRTGQVVYTGTASGAANAQASWSTRRATGGGVSGLQDWLVEPDQSDPAWSMPDVVGDTNRAAGANMLRRGEGTRSIGDAAAPVESMPVFGPDGKMLGNQTSAQGQAPVPTEAPVVAEDDDETTAPVGVSGRAGAAPSRGVAAFAPEGPGSYGQMPDAIRRPQEEERSGFGLLPISKNAGTGLLAAGLGMLASRSPNLGNAVGEGGIAGVSAYGAANENDRKIAAEAAKLSTEARKRQEDFGLNVRKQDEAERHNRSTESTARKNLDRTKFIPAGQYMGEDGIYRPAVMDQSSGRLVDPGTGQPIPSGAKVQGKGDTGFTDEEASAIARRFVASGDVTDLQGIGPAARLKVTRAIRQVQKDLNVSDEELAQRKVEFAGRKAGSRTLGTMEAKMGSAAFEAEGAIKLVRGVIEKLPRTSFLPFNRLAEAYSKKTLNPDQAELYARAQAIVNTYSAVMSRGANVVTDSARHHAGELLNTAYDPTTFNRVLDTMLNEIEMAKASPARMQQFYREHYGPKSVEQGNGSAGGPSAPPAAGGFKPPTGALPGKPDASGKVWYYDPVTKQPYPGQ